MRDAIIIDAVRTPVGRRNGSLSEIHPVDLSAHVLNAICERNDLDPATVDDVIWGCVGQVGDQSMNVARSAVLAAGWPDQVPATTVDRQCGSSQQALHFAAAGVISGQYDLVVAGGVESMSRVPIGSGGQSGDPFGQTVRSRYGVAEFNQGVSAELIASKWKLDRDALDGYSMQSHLRAAEATRTGVFKGQLIPTITGLEFDEGVRPTCSLEGLGSLSPAFAEDGVITAGNSSQISDGSAAVLVTTSATAVRLGLSPMARVHTAVIAGDDPVMMLSAPIPATAKALQRSGLSIDDIGVFEVNEAFAPVPLAWLIETGADPAKVNPLGGAIAVGHPLGASGAILMTRMVHHMKENGIRFGLQTMCEGGGMANATILELV